MFSNLFGLDQPIRALQRMLAAEQLAGTYLFVGPQGVGKTALAMALAQAAACLDPRSDPFDACGECESCRRAAAGAHPEIVLIPPAGDQTQIWQFWDRDGRPPGVLQHSLSFAPVVGRRRVFIVERADTLTEQAANSLLKALEEPPPFALFVLLAPHPARMLPTILSRAHMIRLTPAPVAELARWLETSRGFEAGRALAVAAYAEGRAGTALRLTSDPAVAAEIARAVEIAAQLAAAPAARALRCAEEIRAFAGGLKALAAVQAPAAQERTAAVAVVASGANEETAEAAPKERAGRRQVAVTLDLIAGAFRDMLALRLGGPDAAIVHADLREQLAELATRRTPEGWFACLDTLLIARRRLDQNVGIPLLTDWMAVTMTVNG
jgi:DNA polymerase-3 subunit delta'